jgi:hypothetical protein
MVADYMAGESTHVVAARYDIGKTAGASAWRF